MVSQDGLLNLLQALSSFSGVVRWAGYVDSGSTDTVIKVKKSTFITNAFLNCMCQTLNFNTEGEWGTITANDATSVTLSSALSAVPTAGTTLVIYNFNTTSLQHVNIKYRDSYNGTIATNANISGGATSILDNFIKWSLYIQTAGAINITVEFSIDGGTTYYEIPDSPIVFQAAGTRVFEMGYVGTNIRLTGSNATLTTAVYRGLY